MVATETKHLRVLIANEREGRLALIEPLVEELGHEVVAHEVEIADVGSITRTSEPDVALVGLGSSSEHALELIERIAEEATCPVIAILDEADDRFVHEAAKAGVFAYILRDDPSTWQSMIEIVLRRFADYHDLQGAFGRRAVIERAKGILMERHNLRDPDAFELLRKEARSTNRRVVDIAAAVVDGHPLLPSSDG